MSIVEQVSSQEMRDHAVAALASLFVLLVSTAAFWATLPPMGAAATTVGVYSVLFFARTFALMLSNSVANSRLISLRDLVSLHVRFGTPTEPDYKISTDDAIQAADEFASKEISRPQIFERKKSALDKAYETLVYTALELAAVAAAAAGGIWLREDAARAILAFDTFIVGLSS